MFSLRAILVVILSSLQFACVEQRASNVEMPFRVQQTAEAPDRNRKAVLWLGMGGGAAGWCYQRVSIVGVSDELVFDKEPKKNRTPFVFSVTCSSEVTMVWLDSTLIKIGYTVDKESLGSVSKALKTDDGIVEIVYEIEGQ